MNPSMEYLLGFVENLLEKNTINEESYRQCMNELMKINNSIPQQITAEPASDVSYSYYDIQYFIKPLQIKKNITDVFEDLHELDEYLTSVLKSVDEDNMNYILKATLKYSRLSKTKKPIYPLSQCDDLVERMKSNHLTDDERKYITCINLLKSDYHKLKDNIREKLILLDIYRIHDRLAYIYLERLCKIIRLSRYNIGKEVHKLNVKLTIKNGSKNDIVKTFQLTTSKIRLGYDFNLILFLQKLAFEEYRQLNHRDVYIIYKMILNHDAKLKIQTSGLTAKTKNLNRTYILKDGNNDDIMSITYEDKFST